MKTLGVLLLNMGGPDSLKAVRPFLYNLFSDREIIRLGPAFLQKPLAALISSLREKKVQASYSLIGGRSPLPEITSAQAVALEEFLNSPDRSAGSSCRVYVGMRYWHPLTEETVDRMERDGIERVVALSLYPHYSFATTGSSVRKLKEVLSGRRMKCTYVTSWFNHPLYVQALVEKVREGLSWFSGRPVVLFSAHSLPRKFVDEGDPYVKEIEGTIAAVTGSIDVDWRLSYQSKTGPVKWLEPSTEQMLEELAREGVKDLLVVPISFVSDHIETLYEIDLLYKDMAAGLGMTLLRTASLNTSPSFIVALADIVVNNMRSEVHS